MATIINNPPGSTSEDSGLGVVVGIIMAVVLVILFLLFVLPTIQGTPAVPDTGEPAGGSATVNVTLPAASPEAAPSSN